jgi:threonine synthase
MLVVVAVPTALECLRCARRYPVVPMPGGCPSCSADEAPTNVRPVYGRMQGLRPGRLSGAGLVRYSAQLPVPKDRLISLGEGGTPLIAAPRLGRDMGMRRLLIKDERLNPTGSWRDRYATLAISAIAAEGDGDVTVACAGDEALCVSIAAYAARAGIRSVSLVDAGLAAQGSRVVDAIEGVGGRAVGVDGSEGRWALLAEAERMLSWKAVSNRTSPPIGGDPIAMEGYRTIAYEIVEQLGMAVPDMVAVPVGLGDGIQGIWRGFKDMADWNLVDAVPRLVAVETGGALASALAGGKDWVAPTGDLAGPARSLSGITGTVQGLNAVVESEGLVVRVTDAELEAARTALGEHEGVWSDLASAAGVAACQKLASRGDVPARVQAVCVVAEHGLMDESTISPGGLETVEARVDDLLRVLAVRGE